MKRDVRAAVIQQLMQAAVTLLRNTSFKRRDAAIVELAKIVLRYLNDAVVTTAQESPPRSVRTCPLPLLIADTPVLTMTTRLNPKPSPAASAPVPRSRLSGEQRRNRFLDMAAEIVLESGVAAVTMEAVAARSDVDKRLGYRYFANRDDLLEALVRRELEAMSQRVQDALPANSTFEKRLRVNTRVWLSTLVEQGPLLRRLLYDQGPLESYANRIRNAAIADWATTASAETGLPEQDAAIVTRMLLSALVGGIEALEMGLKSVDEVADLYVAVVLSSLRAATRQAGSRNPE
jgi:AcrR family transcriptional regulator